MSAIVHALARLLEAASLDGPPREWERRAWKDAAIEAKHELDEMRRELRAAKYRVKEST